MSQAREGALKAELAKGKNAWVEYVERLESQCREQVVDMATELYISMK